jgi:dTDP-4-amino-4,6-dideoxygalactose transaminase
LFGLPCPIEEIAELMRARDIRLMEDCAHACGVRVRGRHVGTFGDIGVFSFAEGKNMPCLGGGAIAVTDDAIAERARRILDEASMPSTGSLLQQGLSIWAMWLATRPWVFGLTAFQVLRLKALSGKPLMDSAVGDELLDEFAASNPRVKRFSNLQGRIGLKQLRYIDRFNEGARRNAQILTEELGEVPGIRVPPLTTDNIYVYYPITVDPVKREDLRLALLKAGIDTKHSDMSECSALEAFRESRDPGDAGHAPTEASVLEICVYPIVPQHRMRHIARTIRSWAGLPAERPAGEVAQPSTG